MPSSAATWWHCATASDSIQLVGEANTVTVAEPLAGLDGGSNSCPEGFCGTTLSSLFAEGIWTDGTSAWRGSARWAVDCEAVRQYVMDTRFPERPTGGNRISAVRHHRCDVAHVRAARAAGTGRARHAGRMGSYDGPVLVALADGTPFEAEVSLHDLAWDDDRVESVQWLGTMVVTPPDTVRDHVGQSVQLRLGSGGHAEALISDVSPVDQGEAVDLLGVGRSPFA